MTEAKRKCNGCRCYRTDFTSNPNRCDRCLTRNRKAGQTSEEYWAEIKNDPVKHEAWKQAKRESRTRLRKAKELSFKEVVVEQPDNSEFDVDYEQIERTQRQVEKEKTRAFYILQISDLYNFGFSTTEIARMMDKHAGTVSIDLRESGVEMRSRKAATSKAMLDWYASRDPKHAERDAQICRRYLLGESQGQLGKAFDLQRISVKRVLEKHNVPLRPAEEQWKLTQARIPGG